MSRLHPRISTDRLYVRLVCLLACVQCLGRLFPAKGPVWAMPLCVFSRGAVRLCALLFMGGLGCMNQARAQIDTETVTLMGRNALSVDDYLTAIRYFNQVIEAKPFLARPYYYRAYAKFTLEDYSGAEADCTRSISLNPFIIDVYQLRGLCRIHNEDYRGAVEDYTRTLNELPDEQGVRYNRALCLLQLKDYARADSDLDYLLTRWPGFTRTYMVKAQSAFEQADTLGGLQWIDQLLAKSPAEPSAWRFKGQYALSKQEYALADSCLSRAIALQPDDYELYVSRAQARHELGKFALALDDYDQTIRLVPEHFVAHYNRGLLRSFVGDLNRAIEDFDFIIQVEPDNTLALYNRAQLRAQTGDFKGAIADYSQLIKAYPQFYYGYLARAECRRRIGDVSGALADETYVARHDLDIAFGRARKHATRKVRLRSEHELDRYHELVQEDPDTTRNLFGTLYGKVQNERVNADLLPMYAPAFRPAYTHGYHSIGFLPELAALKPLNTPTRQYCLTAESEVSAAQDAEADRDRIAPLLGSLPQALQSLVQSSVHAARYDYTSALDEANQAVNADSLSVVARLQRAFVLTRSAEAQTLEAADVRARKALAAADLAQAALLSPQNAYVAYNQGCLLAAQSDLQAAIEAFNRAVELDAQLAEAYYNRALLYARLGDKERSRQDFSKAGQLGLYKAYAQIKALK